MPFRVAISLKKINSIRDLTNNRRLGNVIKLILVSSQGLNFENATTRERTFPSRGIPYERRKPGRRKKNVWGIHENWIGNPKAEDAFPLNPGRSGLSDIQKIDLL